MAPARVSPALPPSSYGVMQAAASWTVLCWSPNTELHQGEDGGGKQGLWLDLVYSGGASTTGAARLSAGGKLVLRLGLTGLSPITDSVGAEGNDNAVACAVILSCSHQSYCNSKASHLSSLMFSEQTSLSPGYFVIRF